MNPVCYSIKHLTDYQYSEAVQLAYNEARLVPRSFEHPLVEQQCLDSSLIIEPVPEDRRCRQDSFGNQVDYFSFSHNHHAMTVTAMSVVKRLSTLTKDDLKPFLKERLARITWRDSLADYDNQTFTYQASSQLIPFLPEPRQFARRSFEQHANVFAALLDLMQRIYDTFTFQPGITTVTTSLAEVAKTKTGVCQDYSHYMIACVRSMGLPCRYVSGYLETLPPEGQEKLQGVDASHAWVSVYIPGFAWLDFDPTNNLIPFDQHVTTAWGRDYSDVPPLKGVLYSNGGHDLRVAVDMQREEDAPATL